MTIGTQTTEDWKRRHKEAQVDLQLSKSEFDQLIAPLAVWDQLISRLREFRQARTQGSSGPSLWPEPEAIRAQWQESSKALNRFPRAAFGLPVVFHFKDEGDPPDTTVQGTLRPKSKNKYYDRLASRLILRPLACANGQAVGLAVILEGPSAPPGGLILKGAPGDPSVQADLDATAGEANFAPLNGTSDVLQRFLHWL